MKNDPRALMFGMQGATVIYYVCVMFDAYLLNNEWSSLTQTRQKMTKYA